MANKLGILAGRGVLPRAVINACQTQGRDVFVLAFDGQTDPELTESVPHHWSRLGAVNDIITTLKTNHVQDLIMVGSMVRPSLASLAPDWRATKILARVGWRLGDDGLLKAIIRELEGEGFRVLGVDDIIPDIIAHQGALARHKPDADAVSDIKKGVEVLKSLSKMDVGQAVVVQHGMVLGIEAAEGTDALIKRCQPLQRSGTGPILVKMRKTGQESRADLPAIGPMTVENAAAMGFSGIAIESGGTLILECEKTKSLADEKGVFLYGFDNSNLA